MNIKNIEEAKKYLNKVVYTANDFAKRGRYVVQPLYIGGVHLFYNQVDYDVIGFHLYEDKEGNKGWGEVEKEKIVEKFNSKNRLNDYFFSKEEAQKYADWLKKDTEEREREYDVSTAKELLEKHKIKFEIFN